MMSSSTDPARTKVFVSYSHADETYLRRLQTHLEAYPRQDLIDYWDDTRITPGRDVQQEIEQAIAASKIAILLLSADYLADSSIYTYQLQPLLQAHRQGLIRLLPVLLKSCGYYEDADLARLSLVNTPPIPLSRMTEDQQEENWECLTQAIRDALILVPLAGVSPAPAVDVSTDKDDEQQLIERYRARVRGDSEVYQMQPVVGQRLKTFPLFWNIPFRQNRLFTGGEDLLSQLAEALKTGQTAILSHPQAISGLGGIGKTQIAIEYAYRFRQSYQAILWAHADTRETLIADYIAIADILKLPEKDAGEQALIVEAVKHWLSTHREWLLIFDNADELTLVEKYMPLRQEGHIIITTRAQAVGGFAQCIEVKAMDQDTGARLLLLRAGLLRQNTSWETDYTTARQISEELGGLPLALDQAGAYIEETQCGLAGYLQRYQTQRAILLKYRDKFNVDYPASVATTWSLSFEKVEQTNFAAADLLRLCAFLHPHDIPIELISEGAAHLGPHLASLRENLFALDEALATAGAYSLLRRTASSNMLSIHRLVQAVLLDTMNEAARQEWPGRIVRALNAVFPQEVEFKVWAQCERYVPHVVSCAALIEQRNFMSVEAASLFNRTGWYLRDRASYDEAERLLKRALVFGEKELGREHRVTCQSINELARLYFLQGRYSEAESLYRQFLAICSNEPLQPASLTALNNLADTCRLLGKYEEALTLFQQALALYPLLYKNEHQVKATILSNLGLLYLQRQEYKEAEQPLQQALALRKRLLSPGNPDIAVSLNTLAGLYRRRGQDEIAEPLLQQALKIDEEAYGLQHPEVATDLYELADLYQTYGEYEKAEPLYQRALAICERRLILQHAFMAHILNNLGMLYYLQEKYEKAEPLLQRALALREQYLGPEQLDTAISLNNLGLLYHIQRKYAEAESLYLQAIAIKARLDPPNHPSMAQSLNNLGVVYHKQEKHAAAESLFLQALEIREKHLGPHHPDTAESLTNLGILRYSQGRYAQAESLLKRARVIFEGLLGARHPRTLRIMKLLQVIPLSPASAEQSRPHEATHRKVKTRMAKQSRKKNRGR